MISFGKTPINAGSFKNAAGTSDFGGRPINAGSFKNATGNVGGFGSDAINASMYRGAMYRNAEGIDIGMPAIANGTTNIDTTVMGAAPAPASTAPAKKPCSCMDSAKQKMSKWPAIACTVSLVTIAAVLLIGTVHTKAA